MLTEDVILPKGVWVKLEVVNTFVSLDAVIGSTAVYRFGAASTSSGAKFLGTGSVKALDDIYVKALYSDAIAVVTKD